MWEYRLIMAFTAFMGNFLTISQKCLPYLDSRWVPFFVPAVPTTQTPTQQHVEWYYFVCGVFVDNLGNGSWFLLGFDATLDAVCGFWEHLHSLREFKCLHDCSKTLKIGK